MTPDGAEGPAGTNVLLADTDSDRIWDGMEAWFGGNPLLADTDSDGLLDGVEAFDLGTGGPFENPNSLGDDGQDSEISSVERDSSLDEKIDIDWVRNVNADLKSIKFWIRLRMYDWDLGDLDEGGGNDDWLDISSDADRSWVRAVTLLEDQTLPIDADGGSDNVLEYNGPGNDGDNDDDASLTGTVPERVPGQDLLKVLTHSCFLNPSNPRIPCGGTLSTPPL